MMLKRLTRVLFQRNSVPGLLHVNLSNQVKSDVHTNERIAGLLKITPSAAANLIKQKPLILKRSEEKMRRNLEILKKYGFPDGVFLSFPSLLTAPPITLESHILICKETGIHYLDPCTLLQFRELRTATISALRSMGVIPRATDVVAKYVSAMKITAEETEMVYSVIPTDTETIPLRTLRLELLNPYLSILLSCSVEDARGMSKRYKKLQNRSFGWLRENMLILCHSFGLPREKIVRHSYLLTSDPNQLLMIKDSVKTIAGTPVEKAANEQPKFLQTSPSALLEINNIFKEHGIPESVIAKCLQLYTLKPSTIRKRIKDLESDDYLRVFKTHPRIARIIYGHTKVKKRLANIKSMNIPGTGPSLNFLSAPTPKFDRYLLQKSQWKGGDIRTLLHHYFPDKSTHDIRAKLSVHPHWMQVTLRNIQEVMKLLLEQSKIDKGTIYDALPLVLYPPTSIETAMETTLSNGHAKKEDNYFLHMVLYFLEKDSHFRGDGIWELDAEEKVMDHYLGDFEEELLDDDTDQGNGEDLTGLSTHLDIDEDDMSSSDDDDEHAKD